MKVNKYFLVFLIYFFFNSVGLPHGLLYTTLLAPVFIYWLYKKNNKRVVFNFLLFSTPIVLIHSIQGMNMQSFLKSFFLLFTTYVFTYAFYVFLNRTKNLGPYFKRLLIFNSIATGIAIIFYFTPWIEVFWTIRNLTLSILDFPRMQLLTYEPSYYSTLFIPIVIFYIFKLLIEKHSIKSAISYLVLLFVPLILSFSLGVIATLVITIGLSVFFFRRQFFKKKTLFYSISSVSIAGVGILLLLLVFYPDNPLFSRISDIFLGEDLSAKGRTTDAFKMATLIAKTKSLFFGVGIGQIKIMGDEVVRNYYNYNVVEIPIIRIPSSVGETIGTFGFLGLAVRLILEWYLFFKTKVFNNYYRTAIFIYIFIYQFTGSFLTNIAEYVLWVIAFTPAFHQFQLNRPSKQASHSAKM